MIDQDECEHKESEDTGWCDEHDCEFIICSDCNKILNHEHEDEQ